MNKILNIVKDFVLSSTGQGISLRLQSFTGFVVFALGLWHFHISADQINVLWDYVGSAIMGAGMIVAAVLHVAAWARANFNKQNSLGRYSKF